MTFATSLLRDLAGSGPVMALADAVLKSTVLLVVALAVAVCGKRLSPSVRSWVLLLAALSVPWVFAVSVVGPDWGVKWDWAPTATPVLAEELDALPGAGLGVVSDEPSFPAGQPNGAFGIDWPAAMLTTWLGVAGLWALSLAGREWRRRLASRGLTELSDGPLLAALEVGWRQAGLRKCPALFLTESWVMPATFGWRHPAILLPGEAAQWPKDRLRHVLWHEMAHIVRRDVLAQGLAEAALVLLWFHPLGWITRRVLSALGEAACDDLVLTRGEVEPAAYSEDLLALVRRHFQRNAAGGLAMARSSKVGARVRRLLDETAPRLPLSLSRQMRKGVSW